MELEREKENMERESNKVVDEMERYDAVIVGAGHAGCEAGLALARKGHKTLVLTVSLDNIAYLACNPSIGGTAKGHLVREIDALGGEMAINTDKTLIQLKMLNSGKGAAVQSLRAQADKYCYHNEMKKTLENTPNLDVRQGEVVRIFTTLNQEKYGFVPTKKIFNQVNDVQNLGENTLKKSCLKSNFMLNHIEQSSSQIHDLKSENREKKLADGSGQSFDKNGSNSSQEIELLSIKTIEETTSNLVKNEDEKGMAAVQNSKMEMLERTSECQAKTVLDNEGMGTEKEYDFAQITGIETAYGERISCDVVILCCGVYLKADIIIGEYRKNSGPSGFMPANGLTESLTELGFTIRRFKTGTPARVARNSLDFSKMTPQYGDEHIRAFSFLNDQVRSTCESCYLTYTGEKTLQIIHENIHRAPMYSGKIKGIGPRYCPSIEDKVVRFADKDKHQLFIEPEGENSTEMYVQGMSTSMPIDVQLQMYRSVIGFENVKIMRYAYAIEYDCLDATELNLSLESKKIKGLYAAGQINGSSGYEEAAAQGLIAGINAALELEQREPLILSRADAYIGVLIDDLVTKGTNEPYRMMTSRAEYRLNLRQDNADVRLTEKGWEIGLVTTERYAQYNKKLEQTIALREALQATCSPKKYNDLFVRKGETITGGMKYSDMLKRSQITIQDLVDEFGIAKYSRDVLDFVETEIKYEGYLKRQNEFIDKLKKAEKILIPKDIDYLKIEGICKEARQKLDKIRPQNLAQASGIIGVSPADIAVLMLILKNKNFT